MLRFKIISAKQFSKKLKAAIQQTGRLGFTEDTSRELGFSQQKYIKVAQDEESGALYAIILDEQNEDAFKVCRSGAYYYLPTKQLFDMLGLDYKNKTIIFDLVPKPELDGELGGKVLLMDKREKKKMKEER